MGRQQGLAALDIIWDDGPNAAVDSDRDLGRSARRQRARTASSPKRTATPTRASRDGDRLEAAYELPFLAHAHDGADELHGPCHAGRLRDLGRHPGHDARAAAAAQDCWACRSKKSPCTIT